MVILAALIYYFTMWLTAVMNWWRGYLCFLPRLVAWCSLYGGVWQAIVGQDGSFGQGSHQHQTWLFTCQVTDAIAKMNEIIRLCRISRRDVFCEVYGGASSLILNKIACDGWSFVDALSSSLTFFLSLYSSPHYHTRNRKCKNIACHNRDK